ncbi:MAG: DinB family protein [Sphingobacteriales bacterium]
MSKAIEILKNPHALLIKLTGELSIEQLNEVPAGFNNNIIWNMGHIVAAQQGLCYKRAGLDTRIDESLFSLYKSGTKPEGFVDSEGVEEIKTLLLDNLEQLETDYNNKIFTSYTAFTTRYGVEIGSIDDAIGFLPFHDGLHLGYILALKRVVLKG